MSLFSYIANEENTTNQNYSQYLIFFKIVSASSVTVVSSFDYRVPPLLDKGKVGHTPLPCRDVLLGW